MSDGGVIPKEKQTTFQRYELSSLNADKRDPELPTEDEIAAIHAKAKERGYADGLAQGNSFARQAGLESNQQQITILANIISNLNRSLVQADREISSNLLALAADIAKAVLKTTVEVDAEVILPVVREMMLALPFGHGSAILHLNPQDMSLVEQQLGPALQKEGWTLSANEAIERGGCIAESNQNLIDATLPARWKRIATALGVDGEWNK